MKKLLASLLALMLIIACAAPALAAEGAEPDWTGYDELIAKIKASTDFVEREALMHQAEDMLMDTGCIVPIYYYNDVYMQKPSVEGVYSNAYGTKYFMHATNGDSTKLRNLTGWAPQYTFEQGLAATIEFLRGNLDQYKVGQYIL